MHRLGEANCEHNKIAFAWKCLRSVWAVTTGTGVVVFYIVLHVLVMRGRQLNSSSMIMPRCRCSWTCSMWLSLRLRLRISGRSWCFSLVASSIPFVFAGCKIIAFLSQPSQHCILAPQGPHAVLLVSAWARVCVLGTWRVPSGLAPSAVGGEIIRANPRFARLRQIEVHPLAATFRERPSTGWS